MKRFTMLIMLVAFLGTGLAMAEGEQQKCPVMKGKINKKIYADYKDKRVYFCCAPCLKKFNAEPEKYIKEMEAGGVKLHKLKPQSVCPVMGGKINKKLYADVKGRRIYVCCAGCIPKIKKDPGTYIAKIAEKGEYPEHLKKEVELHCIPCL